MTDAEYMLWLRRIAHGYAPDLEIRAFAAQVRREALREAVGMICPTCKSGIFPDLNTESRLYEMAHSATGGRMVWCNASSIHHALAEQEGGNG